MNSPRGVPPPAAQPRRRRAPTPPPPGDTAQMFVPLILSALLPLNPALFMRELISWFICIFLDTLDAPETRAWIKANPKDRSDLLDLLG